MSSDFTSALTSPKVSRSLRVASPSIVNIDCDQKILPRDRSQSHNPQRPRLSAVSIRPRTASLIRSPSRARVDCQWNAKPRISTTKPVVAESVTESAASERHSESIFSWTMMTWPGSDRIPCRTAIAPLPFGSVISATPACCSVSGTAAPIASRMPALSPSVASVGMLARTRRSAPVTMTWRPAGEKVGDRRDIALDGRAPLPVLIDELDEGAETDGDQEGNDQGGHCATKRGLRYQQSVVGRFCDRLRQSLNRIGRTRSPREHAPCLWPPRKILLYPVRKQLPGRFRITIDLNPVFANCREATIR